MKYALSFQISVDNSRSSATFHKTIETTAHLSVGDDIVGQAWKDPVTIEHLTYNMDNDECWVRLGGFSVRDEGWLEQHRTVFKQRGWSER